MKAFVVLPFKDPYESILKEVVSPILENNNIRILRGDDPKISKPIIEYIKLGIAESNLIIAFLVEKNQNCYYELGVAPTLNKPTIIITDNAKNLAFNITHLRVIEINKIRDPTFSKFKIEFQSWIDSFNTEGGSFDFLNIDFKNKTNISSNESLISLLDSINNQAGDSIDFDTTYEFDVKGNCFITRNYKYFPNKLSYFFKSGINLDKPGNIGYFGIIHLLE